MKSNPLVTVRWGKKTHTVRAAKRFRVGGGVQAYVLPVLPVVGGGWDAVAFVHCQHLRLGEMVLSAHADTAAAALRKLRRAVHSLHKAFNGALKT